MPRLLLALVALGGASGAPVRELSIAHTDYSRRNETIPCSAFVNEATRETHVGKPVCAKQEQDSHLDNRWLCMETMSLPERTETKDKWGGPTVVTSEMKLACNPDWILRIGDYAEFEDTFPTCHCTDYANTNFKDGLESGLGNAQAAAACGGLGFAECELKLRERLCLQVPSKTERDAENPTPNKERLCYAPQPYDPNKGDAMGYFGCRGDHWPCVHKPPCAKLPDTSATFWGPPPPSPCDLPLTIKVLVDLGVVKPAPGGLPNILPVAESYYNQAVALKHATLDASSFILFTKDDTDVAAATGEIDSTRPRYSENDMLAKLLAGALAKHETTITMSSIAAANGGIPDDKAIEAAANAAERAASAAATAIIGLDAALVQANEALKDDKTGSQHVIVVIGSSAIGIDELQSDARGKALAAVDAAKTAGTHIFAVGFQPDYVSAAGAVGVTAQDLAMISSATSTPTSVVAAGDVGDSPFTFAAGGLNQLATLHTQLPLTSICSALPTPKSHQRTCMHTPVAWAGQHNKVVGQLKIPRSVKSIPARALEGCTDVTSIFFRDDSCLESIDDGAFHHAPHLTSVDFNSVLDVGVSTATAAAVLTKMKSHEAVHVVAMMPFQPCSDGLNKPQSLCKLRPNMISPPPNQDDSTYYTGQAEAAVQTLVKMGWMAEASNLLNPPPKKTNLPAAFGKVFAAAYRTPANEQHRAVAATLLSSISAHQAAGLIAQAAQYGDVYPPANYPLASNVLLDVLRRLNPATSAAILAALLGPGKIAGQPIDRHPLLWTAAFNLINNEPIDSTAATGFEKSAPILADAMNPALWLTPSQLDHVLDRDYSFAPTSIRNVFTLAKTAAKPVAAKALLALGRHAGRRAQAGRNYGIAPDDFWGGMPPPHDVCYKAIDPLATLNPVLGSSTDPHCSYSYIAEIVGSMLMEEMMDKCMDLAKAENPPDDSVKAWSTDCPELAHRASDALFAASPFSAETGTDAAAFAKAVKRATNYFYKPLSERGQLSIVCETAEECAMDDKEPNEGPKQRVSGGTTPTLIAQLARSILGRSVSFPTPFDEGDLYYSIDSPYPSPMPEDLKPVTWNAREVAATVLLRYTLAYLVAHPFSPWGGISGIDAVAARETLFVTPNKFDTDETALIGAGIPLHLVQEIFDGVNLKLDGKGNLESYEAVVLVASTVSLLDKMLILPYPAHWYDLATAQPIDYWKLGPSFKCKPARADALQAPLSAVDPLFRDAFFEIDFTAEYPNGFDQVTKLAADATFSLEQLCHEGGYLRASLFAMCVSKLTVDSAVPGTADLVALIDLITKQPAGSAICGQG